MAEDRYVLAALRQRVPVGRRSGAGNRHDELVAEGKMARVSGWRRDDWDGDDSARAAAVALEANGALSTVRSLCHPEPIRLRSGQAPPRDPGSLRCRLTVPPTTARPS